MERLRVRSDRRPIYNLDDSDDDADLLPRNSGTTQEKIERIERSDAVCYFLFALMIFIWACYTYFRIVFTGQLSALDGD